jgi:hypothetical protein
MHTAQPPYAIARGSKGGKKFDGFLPTNNNPMKPKRTFCEVFFLNQPCLGGLTSNKKIHWQQQKNGFFQGDSVTEPPMHQTPVYISYRRSLPCRQMACNTGGTEIHLLCTLLPLQPVMKF